MYTVRYNHHLLCITSSDLTLLDTPHEFLIPSSSKTPGYGPLNPGEPPVETNISSHEREGLKVLNPTITSVFWGTHLNIWSYDTAERHCRLRAGHQFSCCWLALLTNRAGRCGWWGCKKPRALGRELWDIKLGVMCSFCHTNTTQLRVLSLFYAPICGNRCAVVAR